MRRLALSVRDAINRAGTEYRLEATMPKATENRRVAEAHVPPGGLLVKDGRNFIPLDMVKK